MSDTNFRPARSTGYAAGSGSAADPDLMPMHPRGSGRSYEAEQRSAHNREESYLDQASAMADDAWEAGRGYYDQGSRRVTEWADDHPNQLWAAIAIAGALAIWMAYRPVFGRLSRSNFDPSRYRYRRQPRPSGRAAFMESGARSADTKRRGM